MFEWNNAHLSWVFGSIPMPNIQRPIVELYKNAILSKLPQKLRISIPLPQKKETRALSYKNGSLGSRHELITPLRGGGGTCNRFGHRSLQVGSKKNFMPPRVHFAFFYLILVTIKGSGTLRCVFRDTRGVFEGTRSVCEGYRQWLWRAPITSLAGTSNGSGGCPQRVWEVSAAHFKGTRSVFRESQQCVFGVSVACFREFQ